MATKKTTIADLEKIKAAATQERAQAAIDLTELVKRGAILEQEAQAAADSGDLATYREKKAKADAVNEEIFVKQSVAAKQENPITEDMTAEAWETYCADYDKTFKAKYSTYQAAKGELLTMYRELLKMQREAFAKRERLAEFIHMDISRTPLQIDSTDIISQKFPCKVLPVSEATGLHMTGTLVRDADAIFYLAGKNLTPLDIVRDPETVQMFSLLVLHRSKQFS